MKLLRDGEAEVRVAAAGKVSALCKLLKSDAVTSAVVPCVKDLAADTSQYVRSALAAVVMELAPVLGKNATIELLLPVFLSLLKDEFPEVRLNIISKLDQVNQVRPGALPALSLFLLSQAYVVAALYLLDVIPGTCKQTVGGSCSGLLIRAGSRWLFYFFKRRTLGFQDKAIWGQKNWGADICTGVRVYCMFNFL